MRPVTLLTSGTAGAANARSPAARANSGSTGSSSALWRAWLARSRSQRSCSPAQRVSREATRPAGPLTTWWTPFSAATSSPTPETPTFISSTSARTRSSGAETAVIAPPSGCEPVRAPRRTANRMPSSSPNTPAVRAAASSPTPYPSTASGRIPTSDQRAARAQASAKSAGWVNEVSSRSPEDPAAPNITASSDSPRSARNTASQRSSTSRAAGSRSWRSRPIPTHWLPSPGNRKATFPPTLPASTPPETAAAPSPSRRPAVSRKRMAARLPKWVRPVPATQARSAHRGGERSPPRASSQAR